MMAGPEHRLMITRQETPADKLGIKRDWLPILREPVPAWVDTISPRVV